MLVESPRGNKTCGITYNICVERQGYGLGDDLCFAYYGSLRMKRDGPKTKTEVVSEDSDSDNDHNLERTVVI